MLRSLGIPAFLLLSLLQAQVTMPSTTRAGLLELKKYSAETSDPALLTARAAAHPAALVVGRCMIGLLGTVNDQWEQGALPPDILREGARVGNILSFRLDAHHLHLLETLPGLEYVELAGKAVPTLDKVVKAVRADSVHMGIHLPASYTGKDVLIGITDWGFDFTHPMFHDTTLTTSRIRAAWDQYRNAGPAPAQFGYGTEFTSPAALLAAQSDTANIYSYSTHGTHVAGIAGGSGAGTAYRGIAFESGFLFCTFLIDAAAVIDGFVWMRDIAQQDGKRLVVNMSWGLHHMGTLDGQSLLSQAIDQLSQEGVVFVSSGGNNGDVNFHIGKEFNNDTIHSRIQFYPYAAHQHMWGQSISMWGGAGEAFSAGIKITNNSNAVLLDPPWYHTATQQAYLDSFLVVGGDTVFFNLAADAAHPLNGRPHFRLRVKNTHSNLKVVLKAAAADATVHFWNVTELTNGVGNWGQAFQAPVSGWTAGDKAYGIAEPAAAESTIAVAAYYTETTSTSGAPIGGFIADFSSSGPTLDGRIKPDVAAPGVSVASSISSFTDANFTSIASVQSGGNTYPFAQFSGTSMSAPVVTGIVALMLEADPTLTPAQVRDILRLTTRTDNHTGTIPPGGSTRWGMGKVNAYRAVAEVLGVVSVMELERKGIQSWPNPTTGMIYLNTPLSGQLQVRVMDPSGRVVLERSQAAGGQLSLDTGQLSPGIYTIHVVGDGQFATGRFCRH